MFAGKFKAVSLGRQVPGDFLPEYTNYLTDIQHSFARKTDLFGWTKAQGIRQERKEPEAGGAPRTIGHHSGVKRSPATLTPPASTTYFSPPAFRLHRVLEILKIPFINNCSVPYIPSM
ncbi:MAG: hypothetical protein HY885_01365 [Deltaproteobacteria bacterium]|nr:hypothetical protein [Deltaproteobacteria bacterium]